MTEPKVPFVHITESFTGRRTAWWWSWDQPDEFYPGLRAWRAGEDLEPWHYMWQPFRSRGWPLSEAEEAAFITDLERRAKGTVPAKRQPKTIREDSTLLLAALRCGLGAEEFFENAPGTKPRRLLDAYAMLDKRRREAVEAWEKIAQEPSIEALLEHGPVASTLLPVPVRQLLGAAEYEDWDIFTDRFAKVAATIETSCAEVAETEAALAVFEHPSGIAVELGRLLFDPHTPSLWADAHFVPQRVGQLVGERVASLHAIGRRPKRR